MATNVSNILNAFPKCGDIENKTVLNRFIQAILVFVCARQCDQMAVLFV